MIVMGEDYKKEGIQFITPHGRKKEEWRKKMRYINLMSIKTLMNWMYSEECSKKMRIEHSTLRYARKKLYGGMNSVSAFRNVEWLEYLLKQWEKEANKNAFAESTIAKREMYREILKKARETITYDDTPPIHPLYIEWCGKKDNWYRVYNHTLYTWED